MVQHSAEISPPPFS